MTCCLVLLSFFIYREVCASETCKGPCKIASEFQVSRWRAAELQIAQKERKKERMTCCFWTCWFSAAIVLQISRGLFHISQHRLKGKITGKLKFIFLGASYIYMIQTSLLRIFVFWNIGCGKFQMDIVGVLRIFFGPGRGTSNPSSIWMVHESLAHSAMKSLCLIT